MDANSRLNAQGFLSSQALRAMTIVQDAIGKANLAAQQGEWDTVVAKLRSAMQALGDQAPQELRQNLAVALANRANKNAEQAMKVLAAAREAAAPDLTAARPDLGVAFAAVRAEYQAERRAKRERRQGSHNRRVLWMVLLVLAALPIGWLALTHKGTATLVFGVSVVVFYCGYLALLLLGLVFNVLLAIGRWFKNMSVTFDPYAGNRYTGPRKSCQVCGTEAS